MTQRDKSAPVPLHLRVPNSRGPVDGWRPLTQLLDAKKRSVVAVFAGPGNAATTATLLAALHQSQTVELARCLYLHSSTSNASLVAAIVESLCLVEGQQTMHRTAIGEDDSWMAAVAIDLADGGDWTIVLDGWDLTAVDPSVIGAWDRYARRSRMVVVSDALGVLRKVGIRDEQIVRPADATEHGVHAAPPAADERAKDEIVSSVELALRERRLEHVVQLLAEGTVRRELARPLWTALALDDSPILERPKMELALMLGDARALSDLPSPSSREPATRLTWARVLLAKKQWQSALDVLASVPDSTTARLARARALVGLGELSRARETAEAVVVTNEDESFEADAIAADISCVLGDHDRALALLRRQHARLKHRDPGRQIYEAFVVARGFAICGEMHQASEIIQQRVEGRGDALVSIEHGRQAVLLMASIALDSGRLTRAGDLLKKLERAGVSTGTSDADLVADGLRHQLDLAMGRIDEARAQVVATRRRAVEAGHGDVEGFCDAIVHQLVAVTQRPHQLAPTKHRPLNMAVSEIVGARATQTAILLGNQASPPPWHDDPPSRFAEVAILRCLVDAQRLAIRGDLTSARARADEASERARRTGHGLLGMECDVFRVQLAVVDGDPVVEHLVAELVDRTDSLGSPRFRHQAALLELVVADLPACGELERLAHQPESPTTARLALCLLGQEVELNSWEHKLVHRILARPTWHRFETVYTDPANDVVWGVDLNTRQVWTKDHQVDLSRASVLWAIVRSLATRAGACVRREELHELAWGSVAYHPLQHDNRIRLAIRKLRKKMGEGDFIGTADGGYRAQGTVRVRSASPSHRGSDGDQADDHDDDGLEPS